jgi:hypothetical protein
LAKAVTDLMRQELAATRLGFAHASIDLQRAIQDTAIRVLVLLDPGGG